MAKKIYIGMEVVVKKAEWKFGKNGVSLADTVGVITSIKGVCEDHFSNHKYEIQLSKSTVYTNNTKGTGHYLFTVK